MQCILSTMLSKLNATDLELVDQKKPRMTHNYKQQPSVRHYSLPVLSRQVPAYCLGSWVVWHPYRDNSRLVIPKTQDLCQLN